MLVERSYLVHPGELDHPLMVVQVLRDTADAVDEHLAAAWSPTTDEEPAPEQITCEVTTAELTAAGKIGDDHVTGADFADADRTAAAFSYLTRDTTELPLTYALGLPLLVRVDGRTEPVPASTASEAATAEAGDLLWAHPIPDDAQPNLRLRAVIRVARLLGLREAPIQPSEVCRISPLPHRLEIGVVVSLVDDLAVLVEKARTELLTTSSGTGRLVVYEGPRFFGREVVTDTVYVHVEELTEIFAAAVGDLAMVARWVLELTQRPGADAVAYYDVLDAWTAWHAHATLLPSGPARVWLWWSRTAGMCRGSVPLCGHRRTRSSALTRWDAPADRETMTYRSDRIAALLDEGVRERAYPGTVWAAGDSTGMATSAPLTFPLQLGDILRDVPGMPEEEGDPSLLAVRAVELVTGDQIPSWPNGTVTRAPQPSSGGYVIVEVDGTDVDLDRDEVIEVVRLYGMLLPAAFLAAADACWPGQWPAPLPRRAANSADGATGTRPAWLPYITHARAMVIQDLAALVWWEGVAADDAGVGTPWSDFIEAARAVAVASLHPMDRDRPAYWDLKP